MEGQDFNPTPTPNPFAGTTPTPDPGTGMEQTAQPVAQDSFAQPTVNMGASWQPSQATAPQVGGMNVAPVAPAPAPAPKKSNIGLIISIVVASIVLIGLVVAIIMVLSSKGGDNTTSSGSTSKSGGDSGKHEVSEKQISALQQAQRNTQREDDIARFLTAVNDYQTNNSGKTPFGTIGDGSDIADEALMKFVSRYIDENVISVENGELAVCKEGRSCAQFSDPDGTMYGFQLVKFDDVEDEITSQTEVDHMIKIVVNAGCGTEEGTAKKGTGSRQIAMFYTLEGGNVVCNDNH